MCVDVVAKRGAVCNTDHHLIAQIRFGGVRYARRSGGRARALM